LAGLFLPQPGPHIKDFKMAFYVNPGDSVQFSKTVSESDVYLFAGVTGDLAPVHVNAQLMAKSAFGQRIAHGALLVVYLFHDDGGQGGRQPLEGGDTGRLGL
jgi:hypothetical protein